MSGRTLTPTNCASARCLENCFWVVAFVSLLIFLRLDRRQGFVFVQEDGQTIESCHVSGYVYARFASKFLR